MKTIEAFAYYGVLGHEKTAIIRSIEISTGTYDKIEIDIPDNWYAGKNAIDETLIQPEGSRYTYTLDEIVSVYRNNVMWAEWYDGSMSHKKKLDWRVK